MITFEPESRRSFLKKLGTFATTTLLPSSPWFLSGCDNIDSTSFVLKNGKVYTDRRYQDVDLLITQGKIVEIGNANDIPMTSVISAPDIPILDCTGFYISPGWVDLHCHIGQIGPDVQRIGPETGVTALVDAGSYGPETFQLFLDNHYANSPIPIYSFLNLRKDGITLTNILTKNNPGTEDIDGAISMASQYPDIVKGFKVRSDSSNSSMDDPEFYARITSEAAREVNLPVMYHLGDPKPSLDDFLSHSRPGDIITHFLRKQNNCILDETGNIRHEALTAKAEGILFDTGHGMSSFSFDSAVQALGQGFDDFTISSDIWIIPSISTAVTFANVISKFLALGMSLEGITEKAAVKPRKILNIESEIMKGATTDLTLFSLKDGAFTYSDTENNPISFSKRIVPEYCVVGGKLTKAGVRDKMLL